MHLDTRQRCVSVLRAGPIPTEIGQLTNLEVLEVQKNQLSGRHNVVGQQFPAPQQPLMCITCLLLRVVRRHHPNGHRTTDRALLSSIEQ